MALANYPGYDELLASGTHLKCHISECRFKGEFKNLSGLEKHLKNVHKVSKEDLKYHWVHQESNAKH